MKRTFLYLIGIGSLVAIIVGGIFFFYQRQALRSQIMQNKQFGEHLQSEIASLQKDKVVLESRNEELSADVVSHLSSINKFQEGNKQLREKLAQKEKKLEATEKTLQKLIKEQTTGLEEKIRYCYNLGVAYTKAKMYEKAIEAYEQALTLNSEHLKSLYNVGLIYHMIIKDSAKAIEFYQRFIEINSKISDTEEVKGWINELSK